MNNSEEKIRVFLLAANLIDQRKLNYSEECEQILQDNEMKSHAITPKVIKKLMILFKDEIQLVNILTMLWVLKRISILIMLCNLQEVFIMH